MSEKICPSCGTLRPHYEMFCQALVEDRLCEFPLAEVPIEAPRIEPASPATELRCVNGHTLNQGDFICGICGADAETDTRPVPDGLLDGPQELSESTAHVIVGWEVESRLSGSGATERFRVRGPDGAAGLLTLYPHGIWLDAAVDAAVDNLPASLAAKVLARGEYEGRRFEVAEFSCSRTLAHAAIAIENPDSFRETVRALASIIHAVSRAGLRHRDIRPETVLCSEAANTFLLSGFGHARLSTHDLDAVPATELTRYTAPEILVGAVSPASDWWSLGIVLLEKATEGACFEGINDQAFLMNVVANGADIPAGLSDDIRLLLRGLLARDRTTRWAWADIEAWIKGEPRWAPAEPNTIEHEAGSIELGGRRYGSPSKFAIAAASSEASWAEARDLLVRGAIATWLEEFPTGGKMVSAIRSVTRREGLDDDTRLSVCLKILNPDMPLVRAGELLTPSWLLHNPIEAYELISGPAPALLEQLGHEPWLMQLQHRDAEVRRRAAACAIELDEQMLRINLLCTSRRRLEELWEEHRRQTPDSDHRGLASLMDRPQLSEVDIIILLSASVGQFQPLQEILKEFHELALKEGVQTFDEQATAALLQLSRREVMQRVAERVENFARCGLQRIDEWVDQFRLERRTTLPRAAVILAVSRDLWQRPPAQEYISQLLGFFEKRITLSVSRGALARMTITKTSPRIDLTEVGVQRETAERILDHILERSDIGVDLDPGVFASNPALEQRMRTLLSRAAMLRRETGIDGLYMGFPFLLAQPRGENVKPRIAPVFLWPIKIATDVGQRGRFSLSFDRDREEIRINPALQNLFSSADLAKWEDARDNVLAGATSVESVTDELTHLTTRVRQASLGKLPGPDVKVAAGSFELAASAVLFHVTFVGQAIVEDIRQLRAIPPGGTSLETLLRVQGQATSALSSPVRGDDIDRYATTESDPTQDLAVVMARSGPGLVIEGPPGTGKSQTIVNLVADAIGAKRSLLIICQKQAALDVVCKRLQREGLGERLVMVTDLSKDRRPVIESVRNQVEAIQANRSSDNAWQRQRKAVLDRIGRLEEKLNSRQDALYTRDDLSGLTYRELVAKLIALEDGAEIICDSLELRESFASMGAESLAEVIESCASLSGLWLPAEYENSPLANLKAFGCDQATINRFLKDLENFCEAERSRPLVEGRTPASFDFDDAEPARRWSADSRERLCGLTKSEKERLAYFIRFFISEPPKAPFGPAFLQRLNGLLKELVVLARNPAEHDLDQLVAGLSNADLERWADMARNSTRQSSTFGRLSVRRYLKRRSLRRYLSTARPNADDHIMVVFLERAEHEQKLRAVRSDILSAYGVLGFCPFDLTQATLADLASQCERLVRTLFWVKELAELVSRSPVTEATEAAARSSEPDSFEKHFGELDAAIELSDRRTESDRLLGKLARWFDPGWISSCEKLIARNRPTASMLRPIVSALSSLSAYQHFRARTSDLSPECLAAFAALREHAPRLKSLAPKALPDAVRLALLREACLGWKSRLERLNPILLVERAETEDLVRSLAQAEAELRQVNKKAITANIETRRLGSRDKWEDITRLTGPRARRLREFMDLGWDIGLEELRPVWLMGPDVASRMLPLRPIFDMVVYDEASQMPVEFALPSLFRGKSVVVSGDEKQLPPTSFFANRVDSDEEESPEFEDADDLDEDERRVATESWNRREIKDCPNLLDLSKSVLKTVMLQVHYRSVYRELIAYSNNAFYGGKLNVPVRHPEAEVDRAKPIEVVNVGGIYRERTNPEEAVRVVDLLAELWRTTSRPPSIGVVTFNRDQADLIEQRLEELAEVDPAFRSAYRRELIRTEHGEDMRFFVKNVENVQGDERDHIIFSTTFGMNPAGKFKRAFGVLGQDGGERRLNVATTRARKKVTLLTSMPIVEISDMMASNSKPRRPRDFLQLYLAHAVALSEGDHRRSQSLLGQVLTDEECRDTQVNPHVDGFAQSVAAYVTSLGVTPAPANDGSAFGIDFAIPHPAHGTYGIGIECEGHSHPILARARAREIWRRTEMQKSIPVIHRVSLRGWYHDRPGEQSRLREAIAQALK